MKRTYFKLNGNNGAVYIFNGYGWQTLSRSLDFYKARSIKANILKEGLRFSLFIMGKLQLNVLKTREEIVDYLNTNSTLDFESFIGAKSSVLISPTRDKIIVNNSNNSFRKIAFGNSYKKVKHEASIYKILEGKTSNFCVSHFSEEKEDSENFYSFLMEPPVKNPAGKKEPFELVNILVEFFQKSATNKITFENYISKLQSSGEAINLAKEIEFLGMVLKNQKLSEFPLGLVHRDFKPWNIKKSDPVLIYDFEEAIIDGLPLEDLFNYHIDPVIRYQKTEEVAEMILSDELVIQYVSYLEKLNIQPDYKAFLMLYLVNRIIFWSNNNDVQTAGRFRDLFTVIKKRLAL